MFKIMYIIVHQESQNIVSKYIIPQQANLKRAYKLLLHAQIVNPQHRSQTFLLILLAILSIQYRLDGCEINLYITSFKKKLYMLSTFSYNFYFLQSLPVELFLKSRALKVFRDDISVRTHFYF